MPVSLPCIVHHPTHTEFFVKGQPTLCFGGELRNSSASTLAFLDPLWEKIQALHLNLLFIPISWRQFEPCEGTFDSHLVQGLITRAQREGIMLALLWLGTWKNGYSGYAPTWMWQEPERFPRMSPQAFSAFGEATLQADQRAFVRLMQLIRNLDPEGETVTMVQVENEIGLLGDSRDRSPLALQAFESPVPAALTQSLETHFDELKPDIRDAWKQQGCPHGQPWTETFGTGSQTDETFMAWHMASFTNAVAQAGKAVHRLPLFVNAWTPDPAHPTPGTHPSGGPTHTMLDIWMAAAPAIDFYAVDNYREDFRSECLAYPHRGNPLFIPEAAGWWGGDHPASAAAKAFFAFGSGALGFAPFGIDNACHQEGLLREAFRILRQLEPCLLDARRRDACRGFYRDRNQCSEQLRLGDYQLTIHYVLESDQAQMFESGMQGQDAFGAFGLVILESDDTFLVAGRGVQIDFRLTHADEHVSLINLGVQEGSFENGTWVVHRVLNGDEVPEQGTGGVKLPPSAVPALGEPTLAIQRVSFLRQRL